MVIERVKRAINTIRRWLTKKLLGIDPEKFEHLLRLMEPVLAYQKQADPLITLDTTTGRLLAKEVLDGDIKIANGYGLISEAGAKLVTGGAGGTWQVIRASGANVFICKLDDSTEAMKVDTNGDLRVRHILPYTNNTYVIGSDTYKVRNIHATNIHFYNLLEGVFSGSVGDGNDYFKLMRSDLPSNEPVFWLHEEVVDSGDPTGQITHLQVRGPIHAYVGKDISANGGYTPYLDLADVNWSWTAGLGASGPNSTDKTWLYFAWVYGTGSYTEVARFDSDGFLQIRSGITTELAGSSNVPTDKVPLRLSVQSAHAANIMEIVKGGSKLLVVGKSGLLTITPDDPSKVQLYLDAPASQSADILQLLVGGSVKFAVHNDGGVTSGHLIPLSDNAFDVGSDTYRWRKVRAVTVQTGDLELKSKEAHWRIIEKPDGLYAKNEKIGKLYRLLLKEVVA